MSKSVWDLKYYSNALSKTIMKNTNCGFNDNKTSEKFLSATELWQASKRGRDSIDRTFSACKHAYIKCGVRASEQSTSDANVIPSQQGRANIRLQELLKLIGEDAKVSRYLDMGCGSGSLTAAVGKYFNLEKGNIIGVDVFDMLNSDITYIKINMDNFEGLNMVDDNSVDLITAYVSLHHIQDVNDAIAVCTRMLAPGGKLIIREHDVDGGQNATADDKIVVDFLNMTHVIPMLFNAGEFGAIENIDMEKLFKGNFLDAQLKKRVQNYIGSIHYRSESAWDELMVNHGLKKCGVYKYDINNPQKLYYACYVKEGDVNNDANNDANTITAITGNASSNLAMRYYGTFDVDKMIEVTRDLTTVLMPLEQLEPALNDKLWRVGDQHVNVLDVLNNADAYADADRQHNDHINRIKNADLKYPILVLDSEDPNNDDKVRSENNKISGRYDVLDGLHRLARAHSDGLKYIEVRVVPWEMLQKTRVEEAGLD